MPRRPLAAISAILALGTAALRGASPAPAPGAGNLARGRSLFLANCGRCHGADGLGEIGPSLVRPVLPNAPDLDGVMHVIRWGIPGTGMPNARWLSLEERRLVAEYVLSLGKAPAGASRGDPARGREIFYGRGGCAACHTVAGQGGITGPDLTEVGLRRGWAFLRRMLLAPSVTGLADADGYTEFLPVQIVTSSGEKVAGVRLNEDGFTIQIREVATSALRSFSKSGLQELKPLPDQSLMPSFAGAFKDDELDDLAAYLSGLKGMP